MGGKIWRCISHEKLASPVTSDVGDEGASGSDYFLVNPPVLLRNSTRCRVSSRLSTEGVAPRFVAEDPTIHDRVERLGSCGSTDTLPLYKIVVCREKMDRFLHC